MGSRTDQPNVTPPLPAVEPSGPSSTDTAWPIDRASRTAGVALLLMSAVAVFGNLVVVDGLITEDDPARTAAAITGSAGLFRLGIASLMVVVALDVVVAWALYRVFRPVDRGLALLATALRLVYSGVFLVAIAQLPGVVRLLGDDSALVLLGADQRNALAMMGVDAFQDTWSVGLFLFSLHLLVLGYLAYRSGYLPRVIGVLLVVSGLGYAADSLGAVLSPGSWTDVSTFTFLGEFLLALWLVIRARRMGLNY